MAASNRIRLALLFAATSCAPARPAVPEVAVRLVLVRGKEGACGCERVANGATVVGCFKVNRREWTIDALGRMADAYRDDPQALATLALMFGGYGTLHPAGTSVFACALR